MPLTLPNVDLSGLVVGDSGSIDLTSVNGGTGVPFRSVIPGRTSNTATVRLHNESSSGLFIQLANSGQQFNLPAGGWVDCYPAMGENMINWTILYQLPNPQVTLLLATYYFPNEAVPAMTALGNSSIGIAGSVDTNVNGTTLQNTGNPAGTNNIIQISPRGDTGTVTSLDNIGTFVNGDAAHPGSVSFDNGAWKTDGSGNTTGGAYNGVSIGLSGANVVLANASGGNHTFIWQSSSNGWTRFAEKIFSGTGSGSFSTGFGSTTPTLIMPDPCTQSGSSQTIGFTLAPTTTVTAGAGLAWKAMALVI